MITSEIPLTSKFELYILCRLYMQASAVMYVDG